MRQRLYAEEEHFGVFKKSSNVKFPLKVGPFFFKNKSTLLVIEKLLESMDFQKEEKVNYDPHHIISQRKQLNKNKPFDHQIVEGLDKMANLSNFEENTEANEDKRDRLVVSVLASVNSSVINKRTLSEADGIDVDEDISHKKIKTHPQDGQTISEEIFSEYLKKMVLFQKKSVQMHQYSFGDESKTEPSSRYKSSTELMLSYADK